MYGHTRTASAGRLSALAAISALGIALIAAGPANARPKEDTSARGCPVEHENGTVSYVPTGTRIGLFGCGSDGDWHFGWLTDARAEELPAPTSAADPAELLPPKPVSTARCRDWLAFKVRTQGGRDQLVVSAACIVRAGERVELRRHEPQGINPSDLLLELVVQRAPLPPVPAPGEVRVFHVEPDAGYKSVTILPDGPTLPLGELR